MKSRSFFERVCHAVGFEVIALLIVAPVAAWIMQKTVWQTGALTLILSSIAMLWNVIYNIGFDRIFPLGKVHRGPVLRTIHALCFEGGFIFIGLPVVAWFLGVSLWQAFWLELGFFLFFLPYTFVYNWGWDFFRQKYWAPA